jgi:GT2 family glycosyltransferase
VENNSPPQVTIVIPNWNGRPHLEACLPTIFAQDFRQFVVYVVDNASTDDSIAWLREYFPQVRLIENEANLGLCTANNQGIRAAETEFVVMLNNDTEVEPDWLGHLVRAAQADPQIGMCASKMLLTDQRDMIESAGIVIDKSGVAWGLESGDAPRNRPGATMPEPVFGACGGAALYRREMLLEIGLFDDDFFVYLEDADVAWRGRWAGWQCVYVPQSVVYHAHSATIKEGSPFKTRLLGRNKLWMIGKSYPFPHLIWYSPLILLYELMAVGYAIVTGRGIYAIQGRVEALRQWRKILLQRRRLVRRLSPRAMMAMLHPPGNPFRLFRRYLNISGAAISGKMTKSQKDPKRATS